MFLICDFHLYCAKEHKIKHNFESLSYTHVSIVSTFMITCAKYLQWLHLFGLLSIKSICYCFYFLKSKFKKSTLTDRLSALSFSIHTYICWRKPLEDFAICLLCSSSILYVSTRYLPGTAAGKPAICYGLYSIHLIVPVQCGRKRNRRITREKPSFSEHQVIISHRTANMSLKRNVFPDFWGPDILHILVGGYQPFAEIWFILTFSLLFTILTSV